MTTLLTYTLYALLVIIWLGIPTGIVGLASLAVGAWHGSSRRDYGYLVFVTFFVPILVCFAIVATAVCFKLLERLT